MVNWAELPCDILEHLTSFLSFPDYHRVSAVCKNWCYLSKQKQQRPAPQLPWLVLKENNVTQKRTFFSLSESRHYYIDIPELYGQYVCGSSFGWLFTLDIHLNFRMINPFNRKSYDLPRLPLSKDDDDLPPSETRLWLVQKIIMNHDPSTTSNFIVMVVHGDKREIAFWRLEFPDWRMLSRDHDCRGHSWYTSIEDIIFFKGQFYAIAFPSNGSVYIVDVGHDPKVQLLEHPKLASSVGAHFSYLVKFMGELMLLRRYVVFVGDGHMKTTKFDVHKLDLEEKKNYNCNHTNDYSFFVGNNSSIVINPNQFSGCKKNVIYFTDFPNPCNWANGRDDIGIYDLTQNTLSQYYPKEVYHPMDEAPIWMNPSP